MNKSSDRTNIKGILLTGGAGYIGGHVVKYLLQSGFKNIFVIDNLSSGKNIKLDPPAKLIIGDVNDKLKVNEIIQNNNINTVIYLAAKLSVDESMAHPLLYYKENIGKFINFLHALHKQVKYFIFSSTAAVYGNIKTKLISETCLPNPINPYGTSKLMAEKILSDYCDANSLKYAILRYFNVIGCEPGLYFSALTSSLLNKIIHTYKYKEIFTINGDDYPTKDGSCIRDYIHVWDLAAAHKSTLDYLIAGNKSDIFNIGYGTGYSVLDIIKHCQNLGYKFIAQIGPRRPGDAIKIIANNTKFIKNTNWQPKLNDLDIMLKSSIESTL